MALKTHERTHKTMLWALVLLPFALMAVLILTGCTTPTAQDEPELTFSNATEAEQATAFSLLAEVKQCMRYGGTVHTLIKVVDGPFNCGGVLAVGCTWSSATISVDREHYEAALGHEFIHLVEYEEGHMPDYKHANEYWVRCDWRNH